MPLRKLDMSSSKRISLHCRANFEWGFGEAVKGRFCVFWLGFGFDFPPIAICFQTATSIPDYNWSCVSEMLGQLWYDVIEVMVDPNYVCLKEVACTGSNLTNTTRPRGYEIICPWERHSDSWMKMAENYMGHFEEHIFISWNVVSIMIKYKRGT